MTGEVIEVYANFTKEVVNSIQDRATQESIDSDVNDKEAGNMLLFPKAELRADSFYIEDDSDELVVNGDLFCFGKNIGWIDFKIPLSQEIAIQIIERYLKKLGKLKTVLEATK